MRAAASVNSTINSALDLLKNMSETGHLEVALFALPASSAFLSAASARQLLESVANAYTPTSN